MFTFQLLAAATSSEVGATSQRLRVAWRGLGIPEAEKLTSSQSILEDLLEAQELEDGKVDSWVEAEAALVWTKRGVELNTVAVVDLWLEVVVLPDDAELDDTLWDGDDLQGGLVLWVLLEEGGVLEGGGELVVRLLELWLVGEVGHLGYIWWVWSVVSIRMSR
jgi:hypothetical protein